MAKLDAKLEFLRLVREKKHILFGAFSDTLTKPDKTNAWKELHEHALALALVPAHKDYSYTRDTFWQNMKKVSMKKRDNSRATGTGGTTFTKVDVAVFGIIGKDTPNMDGLPVQDSMPLVEETQEIITQPLPSFMSQAVRSSNKENAYQTKNKKNKKTATAKEILQMKKLKLTIKIFKKENYLKKLKIMQLERALNIPTGSQTYCDNETEDLVEYLDSDLDLDDC